MKPRLWLCLHYLTGTTYILSFTTTTVQYYTILITNRLRLKRAMRFCRAESFNRLDVVYNTPYDDYFHFTFHFNLVVLSLAEQSPLHHNHNPMSCRIPIAIHRALQFFLLYFSCSAVGDFRSAIHSELINTVVRGIITISIRAQFIRD